MKKTFFLLFLTILFVGNTHYIKAQAVDYEHRCLTNDIVEPCVPYYDPLTTQACPYPLTTDDAYCDQFNLYDDDGDLISSDVAACDDAPPTPCISAIEEIPGVICSTGCRQVSDVNDPNLSPEFPRFPYGPDQPYPDLVSAQLACEASGCDPNKPVPWSITGTMICDADGLDGIDSAIGCIPIETNVSLWKFILRWAIGLAGGIAFLLIIYASFLIITSSGHPKKIQAGRELLISAITGLILLIFSVWLLRIIGADILGIF